MGGGRRQGWQAAAAPGIPSSQAPWPWRAGLPPQLFLLLLINCFRLSCLLLPQPLPVATPQRDSKHRPLSVCTTSLAPCRPQARPPPAQPLPDVPVAFPAVPLTLESNLSQGIAPGPPTPSIRALPLPIRAGTQSVLGLPFHCSFLSAPAP